MLGTNSSSVLSVPFEPLDVPFPVWEAFISTTSQACHPICCFFAGERKCDKREYEDRKKEKRRMRARTGSKERR